MKLALSLICLCLLGLAALMPQASAADGRELYIKCAGCHGADGSKPAMGSGPVIKGMSAEKAAQDLNGYKAKTYGGKNKAVMENLIKDLTPADIKALAEHIAKF